MPLQAATGLHVSGYRYLMRRMERALLNGDVSPSGRARCSALTLGGVVTVIALAGCLLISRLWPQPELGDARIAMGQASGALYVRVGDTWHPVLNLASARLIAATDVDPLAVPDAALARSKRGALLGIPGAPQVIAAPLPAPEAVWTICDSDRGTGTAVLIGRSADLSIGRVGDERAVLVTVGSGSPAYLLYRGRRAVVDLADRAVIRALTLQGQTPHVVSQTLLNAVPEAPAVAVPRIRGTGAPAGAWLPGFRVGDVLRITHAPRDDFYVVLGGGVQRIGQAVADMLQFSGSAPDVKTIPPGLLRSAPVVDTLPASDLLDQATPLAGGSAVCARWAPPSSGPPRIELMAGDGASFPNLVSLAQADGRGPALDSFHISPGRSAYVASQSRTGNGDRVDTRYLVTDTGVRFAVHDDQTAHLLGLPGTAVAAPWPVLTALPCGPELSREKASVARDTLAAGP